MTTSQKLEELAAIQQRLAAIEFTVADEPIERNLNDFLSAVAMAAANKAVGLHLILHPENGRRA